MADAIRVADIAAEQHGEIGMMASDIIDNVGKAIMRIMRGNRS